MSWTSLTQAQRNQALIDYGLPLVGTHGGQCKVFVRNVVKGASSAAGGPQRNIPSTQPPPNNYMWDYDPVNFPYVVGLSAPIQNVQLGWILQLRMFSGTPHTFIVSDKNNNGVWMLDSNWSSPGDEMDAITLWTSIPSKMYSKLGRVITYSNRRTIYTLIKELRTRVALSFYLILLIRSNLKTLNHTPHIFFR